MNGTKRLIPINDARKNVDFNDYIRQLAESHGNKTAFIIKHKDGKDVTYTNISYSDFAEDIKALACSFIERGFNRERIAFVGENRYEWSMTYLTQLFCGGICVPLDKELEYAEMEMSLRRSKAKVVVFDNKHREMIEKLIASGTIDHSRCICMDDVSGYDLSVGDLLNEGRKILLQGTGMLDTIAIDPDAMAVILFTSGTTSLAKAVMLSQNNLLTNVHDMALVKDVDDNDVYMALLPYHHTFSNTVQLVSLARGTTTVFCDGLKYIQRNLAEYKVTLFVCVPALIEVIYKRLLASAKKNGQEEALNKNKELSRELPAKDIKARRELFKQVIDLLGGSLRIVISGAAAVDVETLESFRLFGIEAVNGYGMTEASPVIAVENRDFQRLGSVGKALPSVSVKVDNPDENGVGELLVKGSSVMLGYYENEEATAEALADGWLHTGDLAYIDADGYIFLCGRKKDVIGLKNGKSIFPEEIEQLVSELPYVKEPFLFALPKPNDEKNLSIHIKVVYDKGYFDSLGMDKEAIEERINSDIERLNETMPAYKRIHKVLVTDIPMNRTTSGKIRRHEEIESIKKEFNL